VLRFQGVEASRDLGLVIAETNKKRQGEMSVVADVQAAGVVEPIERQTMRRVSWRLMPLLMLGYFCAYLDRSNVGMAATTMVDDLHFSSAVFGFGAGLFFLGYFLAEIPSNLILHRVGARRWIARILITWGIIAGLTAFVWNDWSFYGNRILLGLAEAGFYPGVLLYLTWWFPSFYRSRMMGLFQSASVISLFIGPPAGGLLLQLRGLAGLHGWQWLYIVEGIPPIIMCFVVYMLLTDRPHEANWLSTEQRSWLQNRLDSEQTQREAVRKYSLLQAFSDYKVWLLTLGPKGGATAGGTKVAEIGPVPVFAAPEYMLRINHASGPPGSKTPVHSHPGSESFYVLAGQVSQRTPHGVNSTDSGQSMVGHGPDMAMEVSSSGTTDLDQLVMFLLDATRPASLPAKFE